MMRPWVQPQRSFTVAAITDGPPGRRVTRTRVPNGSVLCAAVIPFGS